ncbi:molybdenum cofactor biosynthesis F family protein [Amphritea balenae]|uniref:Molybdenum cofactor biosynthesis protein F n=1 Tax=Amphritea balenae TaxID=452629 RepID=A0A3P1SV75_9GAMM|nr:molybdenum cofactor biosynthesis F family protein [Amphritea balenae]RRD01061.1 molybdenum cofactor biosynthesis protein F [Amphritea balenae]GGK60246.1 molybdenum cofactor biosynthesis protein F [Amphritea balenae]
MNNITEWVQVGELAEGFASDANTLEYTDDLAGKIIDLHFEDGSVISHRFLCGSSLNWQYKDKPDTAPTNEIYTATSLRKDIYLVNFIKSKENATSISIVLNLETANATVLIGKLPDEQDTMRPVYQRVNAGDLLTPVNADFIQAKINAPYSAGDGHQTTDELIGKRVQYRYSPHECYEHIYLNNNYYTWQCLQGVEKGLAETDLCHYYKIAENLYFFVWREKVIPTLGVIMIDLERMKTTGNILGYDGTDFNSLNNFPVGAYATILNETVHPLD